MLAEFIISRMGWESVWFSGSPGLNLKNRWHVGIWTGPQKDLICAKRCATNEEADKKYLSPGANSILGACLKTICKLAQRDGWETIRKQLHTTPGERLVKLFEFEKVSAEQWSQAEAHLKANLSDEGILCLMHSFPWGQLDYAGAVRIVESVKENVTPKNEETYDH